MKFINQHMHVQAVTFMTKNPEELSGFYQQALNIPVARKIDSDHLVIELENLRMAFDRSSEGSKTGKMVIWFWVENVEQTYTNLVEMGAQVRSNVTSNQRPGFKEAVFYDPDGNIFGLIGPSVPGATQL